MKAGWAPSRSGRDGSLRMSLRRRALSSATSMGPLESSFCHEHGTTSIRGFATSGTTWKSLRGLPVSGRSAFELAKWRTGRYL
jgi:hypothetical protein